MKLTLKQFKGFEEAAIDLGRPLTFLVGPNGSGKSNLIEALELAGFLSGGQMLNEVGETGSGAALEIRGGLAGCSRFGLETFQLGAVVAIRIGASSVQAEWAIRLRPADGTVVSEALDLVGEFDIPTRKKRVESENLVYRTLRTEKTNLPAVRTMVNNFDKGSNLPERLASPFRAIISQYPDLSLGMKHRDTLLPSVEKVRAALKRPLVLDPLPRAMRQYERIGTRTLLRTGSNLSAVLFGLKTDENGGREALARLEAVVKGFPDEGFEGFDFVTTSLHDVVFGLRPTGGGPLVDARVMSDGTLRTLAILAALETAEPGSTIVIEEFDNGVHPSRAASLARAMAEACRRRALRVLVTTHNPATLNALEPSELEGVVISHWSRESRSYRLTAIQDVPRCLELLERGRLGDLVTRRVLDQYLMPGFESERKAGVAEWLEGLP
jgi:predicted ATPase